MLKHLGVVNGAFTATTGTISLGTVKGAVMQVFMDTNSTYEVAVKPVKSAAGTASKSSCAAVLSNAPNHDVFEAVRPAGGRANWYLAYQVYSGVTAAAGAAGDKYAVEKLG